MDFWADHGKAVAGLVMLVMAVGTLVFKQGRMVQRFEGFIKTLTTKIENENKAQNIKIEKNCKALASCLKELKSLRDSKLLTHPDHHLLTIDCRKEITRQMDSQKEIVQKDVKSISETMSDMRAEMKEDRREDRKIRQEQATQLTKHAVLIHGFKEALNEFKELQA